MKVYVFTLALLITFLSACKKNEYISDDEIPQWIKERIAEDEAVIDSAPHLMQNFGAWFRYKHNREFYFEYQNPLMSACCFMYNFNGDSFSFEDFENYDDSKCCERIVWKAPKFDELLY